MNQWPNGPMDHWTNGPMNQWSNGTMAQLMTLMTLKISPRNPQDIPKISPRYPQHLVTSIALILFKRLRVTLLTSIASMDWMKIWKRKSPVGANKSLTNCDQFCLCHQCKQIVTKASQIVANFAWVIIASAVLMLRVQCNSNSFPNVAKKLFNVECFWWVQFKIATLAIYLFYQLSHKNVHNLINKMQLIKFVASIISLPKKN